MDYDIVDDTRPRLQLQSGPAYTEKRSLNKVHAAIFVSVGVVLMSSGVVLVGPLQFFALWIGVSLVLGPFAPSFVTGGDCRVGVGELLLPESAPEDSAEQTGLRSYYSREKHASRKAETVREEVANGAVLRIAESEQQQGKPGKIVSQKGIIDGADEHWTLEEIELLRKLVVKHPRGTLQRWEVISEALGGKHNGDSVVKMTKLLGEKRFSDQNSYSKFLAQRKGSDVAIASPLSQRDTEEQPNGKTPDGDRSTVSTESEDGGRGKWTEAEDKALVTALKAFPKDAPMRWEKVALAIPGRSKAQCFRRFSDLRKKFRSATTVGPSHGESIIE